MEVLYSSNELRDAINRVLASPAADERRVALVAYVSGRAQEFLPDPKGLEIVCWLQPGSTDHLTLRRLRERGARIYQSERMHMKVYWSSRRGCVICSANASGAHLVVVLRKNRVCICRQQPSISRSYGNTRIRTQLKITI